MSDHKFNALEETIAHLEQQINDLNDVVISQGNEMNALKKNLSKLQGKIDILEEPSPEGEGLSISDQAARDKPPHY